MLCPNEVGCKFSRNLSPDTKSSSYTLYEKIDGTFLVGDTCNFQITNPSKDLNDIMYLRIEYFTRCSAFLLKGESIDKPKAIYRLKAGQEVSALKGSNLFLLWQATKDTSG